MAQPEDLGFGTKVLGPNDDRLIRHDGRFNVHRHGMPWRSSLSLSSRLLSMSWPAYLGLMALGYALLNVVFGCAYYLLGPGAIKGPVDHHGLRAFFFSVQTASTIGYGHLYPATTSANAVATLEALVALVLFAVMTGMTYARFTRPLADIVFSERALVAPYRGGSAFEFRIANRRRSQILGLEARVFLTRVVPGPDGRRRSFEELSLERTRIAFFPLSWTIVHPIDADSPLRDVTPQELVASHAEFLVTLTGMDETFSHTVHARSSYTADEVTWNARFADIYEGEQGTPTGIDVGRVHDFEPAS